MKERGILFTPENYTKVEAGTKVQTRRIVKPQPWEVIPPKAGEPIWPYGFKYKDGSTSYGDPFKIKCPFGTVGDRLYCKEAHAIMGIADGYVGVAYKNRLPKGKTLADTDGGLNLFRLTGPELLWAQKNEDSDCWRSPLFMPKWAARLWLELTDVRVERVQQISDWDIVREGITGDGARPGIDIDIDGGLDHVFLISEWRELWIKINGQDSWDRNDWTWVLSFKKVQR